MAGLLKCYDSNGEFLCETQVVQISIAYNRPTLDVTNFHDSFRRYVQGPVSATFDIRFTNVSVVETQKPQPSVQDLLDWLNENII